MDIKKSLESYIDQLSSNSPTPGGGNVAALCGVLASSLGEMVCNLTIGKKKYLEVENEMKNIREELIVYKNDFVHLGKKDNESFDKVMDAFKLPKESDEDKALRTKAIENATIGAAEVPAKVIKMCKMILPSLTVIVEKGNQNSLSDVGVALSLIATSAEGAFLNVLINCSSLTNKIMGQELLKKSEILNNEVQEEVKSLLNSIKQRLMPQ